LGRLHERNKRYERAVNQNLYDDTDRQPFSSSSQPMYTDEIPTEQIDNDQYEQQLSPEQIDNDQYEQQLPPQQPQTHFQHKKSIIKKEHGYTRSPVKLASEIEKDPTPKGALEIKIGGRPIDLHSLEDYMVWKINPYNMKTLMRYHNAKTMEEVKSYSRRRSGGGMPLRTIMLVILLAGMAAVGLIMVMFMPQIMQFFRGFGGF